MKTRKLPKRREAWHYTDRGAHRLGSDINTHMSPGNTSADELAGMQNRPYRLAQSFVLFTEACGEIYLNDKNCYYYTPYV